MSPIRIVYFGRNPFFIRSISPTDLTKTYAIFEFDVAIPSSSGQSLQQDEERMVPPPQSPSRNPFFIRSISPPMVRAVKEVMDETSQSLLHQVNLSNKVSIL